MTRHREVFFRCVHDVSDCRAAKYILDVPYCTALKEVKAPCKFYKTEWQHQHDMMMIRNGSDGYTPITTCGGYCGD